MYHFTFIDEASTSTEQKTSVQQNNCSEIVEEQSVKTKNLFKKTANFLYRYLDQPNCVRIFISKN
jgi:hypothetical protein